MTVKQIYEKLLRSKRAIDFFGIVKDLDELKKKYKEYAKVVHPDITSSKDKYIGNEAFSILNKLYNLGIKELNDSIYDSYDFVDIYKNATVLFEITIKGKLYKFYENVFEGEVASIFKGISDKDIYYLKLAIDPNDNDLIDIEYNILSAYRHQSFPYVEHKLLINNSNAILMREVKGVTMIELLESYNKQIPCEHVMWMLERLLSSVGYLHSNCVIHGNIKPENIIINKETHNVSLLGFSFSIPNANTSNVQYKIVNDYYTAPEVSRNANVLPSSDIYSIGKIAIELLGGNISNNGMPISIDVKIREFIRKMVNNSLYDRPNDAWKLWSELITIRTEIFGTVRFKTLD